MLHGMHWNHNDETNADYNDNDVNETQLLDWINGESERKCQNHDGCQRVEDHRQWNMK